MSTLVLFFEWYYTEIPKKFYRVWKNYIWFWSYYFSVDGVLKTFFSPWRRYSESYGKGFDMGRIVSVLFWNIFSRFMGMILRLFLLVLFLVVEVFTFILGAIFFIFWPLFPLILPAVFIVGIINLF